MINFIRPNYFSVSLDTKIKGTFLILLKFGKEDAFIINVIKFSLIELDLSAALVRSSWEDLLHTHSR